MTRPREDLPGLQAERTLLAWERTALGFLANGALLVARDPADIGPTQGAAAAAAVALALATTALGRRRGRQIGRSAATAPPAGGMLAALAGGVVVLGALDVVSIVAR